MHNNNLYIAEEFRPQYDQVDGSLVSYVGPNLQVGETKFEVKLDLTTNDEPIMFLDSQTMDDAYRIDDLRALIPVLQRVLHDMEQYEGVPNDSEL